MLVRGYSSTSTPSLPKGGIAEVRELARRHTPEAIERLVKEMKDGDTSHVRIGAANSLLDRAWGKPTQPLAGDADELPAVLTTAKCQQRARELVRAALARVIEHASTQEDEGAPQPSNSPVTDKPDDNADDHPCDPVGRTGRATGLERKMADDGASLQVLGPAIDTSQPIGRLLFNMIGAVAQFEHEIVRERIAKAQRDDNYKGRAPTGQGKADEVREPVTPGIRRP